MSRLHCTGKGLASRQVGVTAILHCQSTHTRCDGAVFGGDEGRCVTQNVLQFSHTAQTKCDPGRKLKVLSLLVSNHLNFIVILKLMLYLLINPTCILL